jgi:hypothetical protein
MHRESHPSYAWQGRRTGNGSSLQIDCAEHGCSRRRILRGLRVPTLAEVARIKAWLLADPPSVRDYLDAVVLLERLGAEASVDAFATSTKSTA